MLKRQLAARDSRIVELESDAISNKESYRLEVCTLRCDLIIAQTDLKRETADRMDLEAGFVTDDNFLTSRYSKAQKAVRVRYATLFSVYCFFCSYFIWMHFSFYYYLHDYIYLLEFDCLFIYFFLCFLLYFYFFCLFCMIVCYLFLFYSISLTHYLFYYNIRN